MIDKLLPHGYILNFGNKRIYDPNGLIEEPLTDEDITNHNKKLIPKIQMMYILGSNNIT